MVASHCLIGSVCDPCENCKGRCFSVSSVCFWYVCTVIHDFSYLMGEFLGFLGILGLISKLVLKCIAILFVYL